LRTRSTRASLASPSVAAISPTLCRSYPVHGSPARGCGVRGVCDGGALRRGELELRARFVAADGRTARFCAAVVPRLLAALDRRLALAVLPERPVERLPARPVERLPERPVERLPELALERLVARLPEPLVERLLVRLLERLVERRLALAPLVARVARRV
jgi:hypothetical protein